MLLGIPGYIITSHSYASQTVFVAHKDKPLTLTAAQDTNVLLGFQVDGSLNNYWASPNGLTLTLDRINQPLTVVEPKERNWNDSIHTTLSDPGNSLDVVGTLTIPSSIRDSQQHTLKGPLSGSIDYPTPGRDPNSSDSSGPLFAFHNKTVDVNVPIQTGTPFEQALAQRAAGGLMFGNATADKGAEVPIGSLRTHCE